MSWNMIGDNYLCMLLVIYYGIYEKIIVKGILFFWIIFNEN